MKISIVRLVQRVGLGVAASLSAAIVAPAPAGAHCGGHAYSCGATPIVIGGHCQGRDWYDDLDYYYNDCSGTCYNGGTEGCCSSPEDCAEAPCKPGGCGGACAYWFSDSVYAGTHPMCG